jgi:hypothetical protein
MVKTLRAFKKTKKISADSGCFSGMPRIQFGNCVPSGLHVPRV